MTTSVATQPTRLQRVKAAVLRNERRIWLGALTTVSAVAALESVGIRQHNAFLKEEGLFDKFYGTNTEEN